jgi:hypothetical protein
MERFLDGDLRGVSFFFFFGRGGRGLGFFVIIPEGCPYLASEAVDVVFV